MLFFFFTKLDQMSRVGSRGRHPKCRPKNHQCLILAENFWEKNTLRSFPASISQGALNKADTDGLLILKASTASHSISAWSLDGWGNKGGKRENYSCMPMWKCSLISSEISEDDSNGALKKIPRHSSSSTMGPFWTEKNMLKNMPDFWPFFIGVWTTFYFVNHQTLAKISAFWLHGIANIFFNNYWFKNGLVM